MNTSMDRRRHPRAARPVDVRIAVPGWGVVQSVAALDIAEEGMSLCGRMPVETGMPVLLWLRLPGEAEAIECKARVRWARTLRSGLQRCGLRLVDLTYTEREALRRAATTSAQDASQTHLCTGRTLLCAG